MATAAIAIEPISAHTREITRMQSESLVQDAPGAMDAESEMRMLATQHLRDLVQASHEASAGGMVTIVQASHEASAGGKFTSTSTEILLQYNRQPLHVRSRAEQWELPRTEIQLASKLGEGDGGVIYRAQWRGLDVVAKMLKTATDRASAIDRSVAKADLINEISLLSRLRHPNLVMFLGACTMQEPLIIISEYLSGGNLEDYLLSKRKGGRSGKPFQPPPKLVLQWCMELARALCFLHNCNPIIIHRDLKPANLLLNEDGHLKIGDFGLSKVKDLQKIAGTYRMTGKTGSMRYMAPEVYLEDPQYDEKVDIYSTGLIMWYMTTCERPFDRVPAQVVAEKASTTMLRPDIHPVVVVGGPRYAALIQRCWDNEPNARPSAAQLVDELEALSSEFKEKKGSKCSIM
jgi:serine/threonine protein kinase